MRLIKHFYSLLIIFLIVACTEKKAAKEAVNDPQISNDTIPFLRKTISKKPVATYIVTMDAKLDRKFGVEIFETPETFKYLLVMYYDGTIQNDTLSIPNFGIMPVVKVKPGNEKLSCIIGFLDARNNFRDYKLLSFKDNKLSLSVLKTYGVSTYYR